MGFFLFFYKLIHTISHLKFDDNVTRVIKITYEPCLYNIICNISTVIIS